ncbi:endonuclease/exonuclease/phosphatase family protein [Nocardioides sp. YIM 152315]|uniref:endonuclease/exonuclease/phosphatase family protein n=1 Tax=Nocardioides sp. YIM 152315 TaxID=3031760 RepID=UPI0023DB3867|nr:endonuclease/exonuclease/phosphatase family protein [Nocardioides sp. YIM 152315]MDF1605041.1 endonuclease/exonuclease/phosphatase family protein [Nocardioides sp. YIM 152315]
MSLARLVSAVTSLCALAVVLPAGAGHAAQAEPVELRIGTYNVISRATLETFEAAVSRVKPHVDVLGLQEIGMNEKNWWLLDDPAWGYYRPPALQQNPVIWDRGRFEFVSGDGALLSEADLVEPLSGAYDEPKSANWATIVRLRDLATGELVTFVNVHLVAYAISAGRFIPERPRTARLYRQQLRTLVGVVGLERQTSSAVYVLGDFNAGYEEDLRTHRRALPVRQFGAIGFRSMWERSRVLPRRFGTHDNDSLIDQVWSPARPLTTRIMRGVRGSDHRPAIGTYAVG